MPVTVMDVLGTLASLPIPTRTEADIRSDVKMLLSAGGYLPNEAIVLESSTEDGTGRRIDVEYGALVIECKTDVDTKKKAALASSEGQLAGYLDTRQKQTGSLQAFSRTAFTGVTIGLRLRARWGWSPLLN